MRERARNAGVAHEQTVRDTLERTWRLLGGVALLLTISVPFIKLG